MFFVLLQCLLHWDKFHSKLFSPVVHFGIFFGILLYFSLFLKNHSASYEICLIYSWKCSDGYQTKNLYEGRVLPFAWGYFESSFLTGWWGHIFSIFLYFLRRVRYVFMKFCKDILGITVAVTQKILYHVAFVFPSYFKVF